MSEFWWAVTLLGIGMIGGAIMGYHAGLHRASKSIYDALKGKDEKRGPNDLTMENVEKAFEKDPYWPNR